MKIIRSLFLPAFLASILFSTVLAQDLDEVTITGRIVDSNSAPVVGATVTATLTTTGVARTVITNEDGRYRLIELPPGVYSIKATMQGFANQEKTNLTTVAGQNFQIDFTLQPAGVSAEQIITLEGDNEPVIDSTRTIVGGTINEKQIEEIPNVSRNALDLVLTLGGTSEEQLSTSGLADDRNANPRNAPLEQGNFSIGGGTAYSNNITIDGLDNNDDRSSRDRFQPSLESIAEVQVIQNQFSSEYGRASGGRVNIRTRAGGNKFKGRAFGFFRDESLNANSWYNNSREISRPPLQEINPGFWFSGPVILPYYNGRQRTFFALAYEFNNLADTTLIDAYVPVGSNPRYALPTSTGGAQTCDNSSPDACTAGTAAYVAPYRKVFSTPNRSNVWTARIDHRLFKNNELTVGFQFGRKNNQRTTGAATTRIEDAFQAKNINTDAFNFTDNQFWGNVVNQFRGQWSSFKPSYQAPNPFDPVVLISYRDPVANAVRTLIAGNSTTSTLQNFADTRNETRWQLQDSVTYIRGRHTFKFGFDMQDVVSKVTGLGDATGTFNFGSVLLYTQNSINRYRQNFGTSQDVKNRYYGFFFNDELKPISNMTLSLGLRFERETAVSDKNNWGPRLGIAWDPFKKGKGVIRFGAGIFYNRVLLRTVGDSIQNGGGTLVEFDTNTIGTSGSDRRRTAILTAISNNFPNSYPSTSELRTLVVAACATVVNPEGPCTTNTGFSVDNVSSAGNPLRSVEANLKIPESYQFNIGFEREIFKGWVFEANYTWNKTVRLWRDFNANAPRLPSGYADWTAYLLANPFDLSPTRRYTFYLGATNDPSGIATTQGGATACGTTTVNCFVNLNTINSSSTTPLVSVAGQNNNATGAPIGIATAAIARFRPDQTVSETSLIGSQGRSQYQGLVLELRSRFRKLGAGFGAQYRFVYTLSSTKDDGLNNTSNAEVNGNFGREWARSLQDRRHRIAFSGSFDTPWWLGKLRFSPLVRWGSSAPFSLGAGGSDRNLDDLGTDRLNFSGNVKDIKYRKPGSPVPDALLAQFSLQPIGAASGNLPRNSGTGPSLFGFDLNVSREWKIGDRFRLRPVIEFNNIFNAAIFSYGAEFVDFQALSSTPTATQTLARQNFLVPTRTYRQREIRVGLRFDF
ncbi:MAG: TonB-dependent receptor [Acidobacteria bacterium]|nr:TonB-dependent receptor [Acidobacteriota bacterium]